MEKNGTIEIVDQFQHAFARVFEDQIQQLIQDSRKEALAAAKQILRDSALNNVLEAVVDSAVRRDVASRDTIGGDGDIAERNTAGGNPETRKTVARDVAAGSTTVSPAAKAVSSRTVSSDSVVAVDIGTVDISTVVEKATPSPVVVELPAKPSRIKAKPETVLRPKAAGNAPPVLNDRILEEIEAIREQIRRNELLLSQIKPFVQMSKVQDE